MFFLSLLIFFSLQFIECCKKGANLLIQGPDHCSLLHHAAKAGNGEIVKYILEHGESQWANPQGAVLQPSVSQAKPHRAAGSGLPHPSVVSLSEMSTCSMCEQEAGNGVAMTVMAPDKSVKRRIRMAFEEDGVFMFASVGGLCRSSVKL